VVLTFHFVHPNQQVRTEPEQRLMERQLAERYINKNVLKVLDRLGFNVPELPGPTKVSKGWLGWEVVGKKTNYTQHRFNHIPNQTAVPLAAATRRRRPRGQRRHGYGG
jgi:hypothetical protein